MHAGDAPSSVRDVCAEIRDAIRAAAPHAVFPDDAYVPAAPGSGAAEGGRLRVAGWDPEESHSNGFLLRIATHRLAREGWRISPEATDSDDRSARVSKPGLVGGRLYAASGALTFTGHLEPPAP